MAGFESENLRDFLNEVVSPICRVFFLIGKLRERSRTESLLHHEYSVSLSFVPVRPYSWKELFISLVLIDEYELESETHYGR